MLHYADVRPYEVIDDLSRLAGPATGTVVLPHHLKWLPTSEQRCVRLDTERRRIAYLSEVLQEAQADEDLITYVNADLLIKLWPKLILAERCRQLWEEAHPRLAQRMLTFTSSPR